MILRKSAIFCYTLHMAKRVTGVGKMRASRSRKTAKRRVAKRVRLFGKKAHK